MNSYKSLFGLLLFLIVSSGLMAQEDTEPNYYRYFTIEIENLKEADFTILTSDRTSSSYLKFNQFCDANSKILVLFDASQPKRIEEMKQEILETIAMELPAKKVLTISGTSYSEQSNFCK